MEGVLDEGVGERVDQDHCKGSLSLAHLGEVLKQDCDSCTKLRVTVDEGVAFLKVVTDLLEKSFNCGEDSSKCSKAKLELDLGKVD